ncbi:Sorbitol-6-phosphate 2-dehydrogenase [Cedecea neteri]|uniref:Sorbitol-6-phosphate 2-dehydrogenase n=1 Tax=Cedecea neteri TaxID=158822 RepID=A0A2X2TCZ4_9ENTR|nr:Sorbitol-6-phosphate 2-dehydrogenase [Cedecea neteri]
MNQVAVVIGGGQTLGAFLCHGLAQEGYKVAVVDIQSEKAARVAQEINEQYGPGTAWGFGSDATSEQSVTALAHGVDEIFGPGRPAGLQRGHRQSGVYWRFRAGGF